MSTKRFNADVRSARNRIEDQGIDGVITLEHGQTDGEVIITFIHEKLESPITIHLLSANPAEYPEGNNFLLTTTTQNPIVTGVLQNLQNYNFGQTVFESLLDLATALSRALSDETIIDRDGDTVMKGVAENGGPASGSDGDEYLDEYLDDDFGDNDSDDSDGDISFGISYQMSSRAGVPAQMAHGNLSKVKRDLRKSREAGAKIGIFTGVHANAQTHMFSLSIRAQKLGISGEALAAWDVDPADYIVLLVRTQEPYPSVEQLLSNLTFPFVANFQLGKCSTSKPSDLSARRAFTEPLSKKEPQESNPKSQPFKKLFLSSSMDRFMNKCFISMFKLRLTGAATWDAANSEFQKNYGLCCNPSGTLNVDHVIPGSRDGNGKGKAVASSSYSEAHDQQTLPTILTWDSFAEPPADISMPLVAFQFALHYLVRCTEYCVQCHHKVDTEFEALKPYVCGNPLCLFQYITMGLGPCIEHEILTQPYVVDLLVTLCYSSLCRVGPDLYRAGRFQLSEGQSYAIRTFPTGLRLKVPVVPQPGVAHQLGGSREALQQPRPQGDQSGQYIQTKVVVATEGKVSLSCQNQEDIGRLKADQWVVLRHNGTEDIYNAYIQSFDGISNTGAVELKQAQTGTAPPTNLVDRVGTYFMDLFLYDSELDDLSDAGKAMSMRLILRTLPPIARIREGLVLHPHSRITAHNVSASAATLLEWIIASNRSFILQVSPVHDRFAVDKELLAATKTREEEVIPDITSNYVQFRFAMGNPDKELRFHRALKALEAQSQNNYPTLFAWHGSAIQNWHSILRHGLDYSKVVNGRAFGDGVYFSTQHGTSLSYTAGGSSWPNSALDPSGVMALCEIINSPDKFTSTTPHYVVSQLDWIQCRYLLVKTGASLPPIPTALPQDTQDATQVPLAIDELPQDPKRRVYGPVTSGYHDYLRIPRKALPASRKVKGTMAALKSLPKRPYDTAENGDNTDEEDAKDLEALFSEDEPNPPPSKRFQSHGKPGVSRDSSVDTIAARRLTTQRPLTPPKQCVAPAKTDFRPGILDLKSIPRLSLPHWATANASRRLAADIRLMQKAQASTPIHELGWYIDFDNIENMFQWIVELHTFDPDLPLAKDMKIRGITSIVLELRFGAEYPFSPPFVRVIRPRFLPFMYGGGGHVTVGGAICLEMLTNTGWLPSTALDSVLLSVKMAMSSLDPQPARLLHNSQGDYSADEALDAFKRFAGRHGWDVPKDAVTSAAQQYDA